LLIWTQIKGVGTGFKNLGNTCFINSSLQCLIYTPPIQNFHHVCSQDFCTLSALQRLAEAPPGVAVPEEIVGRMKFFGRQFRRGQQEDAHEFIRCLMDKIHEREFVTITFGGVLRSLVKCLHCNSNSKTFDKFLDLSLELTSSDVLACLRRFCSEETLSESELYHCSRCGQRVPSTKQLSIKKAPLILTLHLKRFSNDGKKDNREMTYPAEIQLPVVGVNGLAVQTLYQLYAILVHDGYASRSGHYYAYILSPDDRWYEVNDARTEERSSDQAMAQGGVYILFYKKACVPAENDCFALLLDENQRSLRLNPVSGQPGSLSIDVDLEARVLFPRPS
jgi:ubiquitin carboxyl-terminal hydrolase 36/42